MNQQQFFANHTAFVALSPIILFRFGAICSTMQLTLPMISKYCFSEIAGSNTCFCSSAATNVEESALTKATFFSENIHNFINLQMLNKQIKGNPSTLLLGGGQVQRKVASLSPLSKHYFDLWSSGSCKGRPTFVYT